MYGNIRAATITVQSTQAVVASVLWKLDRTTFKKIVLTATQPKQQVVRECLDAAETLRELSAAEKEKILACAHLCEYQQGDIILRAGDHSPERYIYLLKSGCVSLRQSTTEVESLLSGHFFGERSSLFDESPMADAVAITPCEVIRVPGSVVCSLEGDTVQKMRENARKRFA